MTNTRIRLGTKLLVVGEKAPFESFWKKVPQFIQFPLCWAEPIIFSLNHFSMNEKKIKKDIAASKKRAMSVTLFLTK